MTSQAGGKSKAASAPDDEPASKRLKPDGDAKLELPPASKRKFKLRSSKFAFAAIFALTVCFSCRRSVQGKQLKEIWTKGLIFEHKQGGKTFVFCNVCA